MEGGARPELLKPRLRWGVGIFPVLEPGISGMMEKHPTEAGDGKKVTDFARREPKKMDLGGEGESKLHQKTAGEEEPPPGAGDGSRRRWECLG